MKVTTQKVYISFDGEKFDSETACKKHEDDALPARFVNLTIDKVRAALSGGDTKLAEAFERFAAQITKARLKAGGSRRKRKVGAST